MVDQTNDDCYCNDIGEDEDMPEDNEESHEVNISPLPCPFCGREVAPYKSEFKHHTIKSRTKYYIQCYNDNCEVNPSIDRPSDSEEKVIRQWNKRIDIK